MNADKPFYTYLWLREDGTPYYVGKGRNRRALRTGSPKDRTRILIQEYPSEADAFVAEMFLITYYGRKDQGTGCLRNLTDGGDGLTRPSIEVRRKISESKKGKTLSIEHRRKLSIAGIGREVSEESRQKLSNAQKGVPCPNRSWSRSIETRRRMSEAQKGKRFSEEHCRNLSESKKGKTWDEARRQQCSIARRGKPWTEARRRAQRNPAAMPEMRRGAVQVR